MTMTTYVMTTLWEYLFFIIAAQMSSIWLILLACWIFSKANGKKCGDGAKTTPKEVSTTNIPEKK